MHGPLVFAKRNIAIAIGLVALVAFAMVLDGLQSPAFSQERMVLGPRQFEFDTSSGGAVLCAWSIYLSIQAETTACGMARRPVDDAFDEAIAAIDEFILANSSLHPTRAALDDFKRRAAESHVSAARQRGRFCTNGDIERFRSISADHIRTSVKSLLAVPREPVMNPCL
jgi:hypothetical protein